MWYQQPRARYSMIGLALVLAVVWVLWEDKIKEFYFKYIYMSNRPLGPILQKKMLLRKDSLGSGWFAASRSGGKRKHNGMDFVCEKGEPVLSPIDGKVTRGTQVYKDDKVYRGIVIQGSNGYEVKIFYMTMTVAPGESIQKGQVIGVCQAISEKYSPKMKNHLHLELRIDGKLKNPAYYIDYITKEPVA